MRKTGISNYQLPERKKPGKPVIELLPHDSLMDLCSIATERVVKQTLRSVANAEHFEARHPFWNAIAHCYVRIIDRFGIIRKQFPGVNRVIHTSEILRDDILVSDYNVGLNYGALDGKTIPLQIRVLEVRGDEVKGSVIEGCGYAPGDVRDFKNEIWFFVSHKFGVIQGNRK